MTSANFKTVSIGLITIPRERRQRRELTGLESLAESIRVVGLINPPVVDPDLILVAGERRLTACRDILGWTEIPVQFTDELPYEQLHLIELEENVKRVDLAWQDECRAIEEYHKLRASAEPSWTAAKTASALGLTESAVSRKIDVAEAVASGDEMVSEADKYSVALGIVERRKARKRTEAENSFDNFFQKADLPQPEKPVNYDDFETELPEKPATPRHPFLHEDFAEWAQSYQGPKFNFIHCDFPYGVNADKHNMGAAAAFGGYEDSLDVYWSLLNVLHDNLDRIASESAHLMFWFSMDYYSQTLERLSEMGWKVNPFPLIWYKADNSGILPDPKRGPRRNYETAFLATRGDRPIVQAVSNIFAAPNKKLIHMSEKNPEMLAHFFRMFVDNTTYMLDPTMGSGQAVTVAERMGATAALGLERDEEFYRRAVDHYVAGLQADED